MVRAGRLGGPETSYKVTLGLPGKEKKTKFPDLQNIFEKLGDVQPVYKSLAEKAEKKFKKRKFEDLTDNPPFNKRIKGFASLPPNRAS